MKHILYTEEEGGNFHHVARHSDKETQQLFDDTVKGRFLVYATGDGNRVVRVRPAYICLVEEVKDFNFILGMSREDARKKAQEESAKP